MVGGKAESPEKKPESKVKTQPTYDAQSRIPSHTGEKEITLTTVLSLLPCNRLWVKPKGKANDVSTCVLGTIIICLRHITVFVLTVLLMPSHFFTAMQLSTAIKKFEIYYLQSQEHLIYFYKLKIEHK